MTLTFNPEIWFKVTENPLPKGNLCVKFKLCWAREKESVPGPDILDRRKDGQTDHHRSPAERSP